jgi:peptidoglycan hydrolase CwlO-like protein
MRRIKNVGKSVSILMALLMVMISAPLSTVFAAMVGTEAILTNPDTSEARDQLRSFLDRKEVQSQLTARGIDPAEAKARVDSLSDAEVMQIADKIDHRAGDYGLY